MITCIVPAKNEADNLLILVPKIVNVDIFEKIILCIGESTDKTLENATYISEKYADKVFTFSQTGKGKFNAILESLEHVNSNSIMIWDADNTVSVKSNLDLISFYLENPNVMVTGDRLKGIRSAKSMPLINQLGNFFFGLIWGFLLTGRQLDLFCGSKLFPKYLLNNVDRFLVRHDSYGDLSLLLTANLIKLPVRRLSVDYLPRIYGKSNMNRASFLFEIFLLSFYYVVKRIYGVLKG